jgi:NH3-dependent NAD+ synthetase
MPYRLDDAKLREVVKNIRFAIGAYFRAHGIKYAVFGKSEGLDSSCIAALLSDIKDVSPIATIMPCESSTES